MKHTRSLSLQTLTTQGAERHGRNGSNTRKNLASRIEQIEESRCSSRDWASGARRDFVRRLNTQSLTNGREYTRRERQEIEKLRQILETVDAMRARLKDK